MGPGGSFFLCLKVKDTVSAPETNRLNAVCMSSGKDITLNQTSQPSAESSGTSMAQLGGACFPSLARAIDGINIIALKSI